MKKLSSLLPILLLAFLTACTTETTEKRSVQSGIATPDLPAGVTLIEDYRGEDKEFPIRYRKFRLDNGLTVILHEDHSDPMVHVDVTYHVGSNREEVGSSKQSLVVVDPTLDRTSRS